MDIQSNIFQISWQGGAKVWCYCQNIILDCNFTISVRSCSVMWEMSSSSIAMDGWQTKKQYSCLWWSIAMKDSLMKSENHCFIIYRICFWHLHSVIAWLVSWNILFNLCIFLVSRKLYVLRWDLGVTLRCYVSSDTILAKQNNHCLI